MKTRRIISVVMTLVMILSALSMFGISVSAADTVTLRADGTYHQTEARNILGPVNSFRTGADAWYWNDDDETKTVCSNLKPLVYDYGLEQIAMKRAAEIALYWAHERPNGQMCFTVKDSAGNQSYAENIAAGYANAQSVMNGWREDNEKYAGQGHRRNMLNGGYTAIGMACFEFNGIKYWVQEFSYYTKNTNAVAANDSATGVNVDVLKSRLSNPKLTLTASSVSVEAGGSKALPGGTLTVDIQGKWPSSGGAYTVVPSYTSSDSNIAEVSGGNIVGKNAGTTTVKATFLTCSVTVSVTVTGCNHVFKDTVIKPATHYERGTLHRECQKCGYSYDTYIPKLSYYDDVRDTEWYFECVDYCTENGFVTGYGDRKFGPANELQRQDFVVIIARIAGADVSGYTECKLPDVDMNSYYGKSVAWAVDKGIITGYNNGFFGVGDKITREQVCTILYRFMGAPDTGDGSKLAAFNDSNRISGFALDAMTWAVNNGVISGKNPTTLAPVSTASRAEITMIIMRMDKAGMFAA